MDIVFIGVVMIAFAFVVGILLLIYLVSISTIRAYKEKEWDAFILWIILGFALLIIGSV